MTSHVDAFDKRPRCVGSCGHIVLETDQICASCWNDKMGRAEKPKKPRPKSHREPSGYERKLMAWGGNL